MITSTIRPGGTNSGSFDDNDAVFGSLAQAESAAQSYVPDTDHTFLVEGGGTTAGAVTLSGWFEDATVAISGIPGERWQDLLTGILTISMDNVANAAKIQMPTDARAISIGMENVTIEDMVFMTDLDIDAETWSLIRFTADVQAVHIRRNLFMVRSTLGWNDSNFVTALDMNFYNVTDSSVTDNVFIAQTLPDNGLELLRAMNFVVKGPSDSLVIENNTVWSSEAEGIYTGGWDVDIRVAGTVNPNVVVSLNMFIDARDVFSTVVAATVTIDDNICTDSSLGGNTEVVGSWSDVLTGQFHDSPDHTIYDLRPKSDALGASDTLYKPRTLDAFRLPRLNFPIGGSENYDVGARELQYIKPAGGRTWFFSVEDLEESLDL